MFPPATGTVPCVGPSDPENIGLDPWKRDELDIPDPDDDGKDGGRRSDLF